ncbi:MAG: helix-turn-helix domain-containing protein [Gaiellaceae bacterium]
MSIDGTSAAGETIGQRLKRLRLERGLSQRELSAPGVSYAYISRIEAGTRQPSVKALRKLAANLSVTADYLETGSNLARGEALELRLADLELAVRLGTSDGARERLTSVLGEATAAGDTITARRARVVLAELSQEKGAFTEAVALLEAAIGDEPFSPVVNVGVYSQLGRAYAAAGRTRQAVDLFERCIEELAEGDDPALEARYATLLSYALSDLGELARAEEVVQHALARVDGSDDPYTRVRLYWSLARLADAEGREWVALTNVRRAIALLQATDDSLHLARAHLLAARITLARDDSAAADNHLEQAARLFGASLSVQDAIEMTILRSRVARLQGEAGQALALAREAQRLAAGNSPVDEGFSSAALADAHALAGDNAEAGRAYGIAVDLLEAQSRWRDAAQTCRTWGQMLRDSGDERAANDVLDRAAQLGLRAAPAEAHARR